MQPYYEDESVTLHHGDCLDVMAAMPDASVDAVVTDPPYGLGFMGREWDDLPPGEEWARECLRVLKPGGYLLAFGGTRTWHRLAVAVEDAGFEVRDSIAWLHGQGFPKGKAQLKPAFEPVVVARRRGPIWLNVDGCRVPVPDRAAYEAKCASVVGLDSNRDGSAYGEWTPAREDSANAAGRWPTNVVLDGDAADELDRQSGISRDGVAVNRNRTERKPSDVPITSRRVLPDDVTYGGQGGASRFFPTFREGPKDDGYEDGVLAALDEALLTGKPLPTFRYEAKAATDERPRVDGVAHPTVKPLDLMRWLVRLVTPPGGTVLEPFAGSGTTAEACVIEGFRCIAIEREADYLPLIVARLSKPIQPDLFGGAA